ncbi:hypothetical protein D1872_273740 [compost metagenome]
MSEKSKMLSISFISSLSMTPLLALWFIRMRISSSEWAASPSPAGSMPMARSIALAAEFNSQMTGRNTL